MAAFDPFNGNTAWPDGLVPASWVKRAPALATLEDGRALALALQRLEALYKKVDLPGLRPRKGQSFDSLDALDGAEKQAKAAYRNTVVPLVAQCVEVRKQAVSVAKQAQSAGVDKAMLLATADVARLVDQVAEAFKALDDIFRPFDDARKQLVKSDMQLRKAVMPAVQALDKALDACLKKPSREAWDKGCKDPCKSLHNLIRNTPELKEPLWATWKVHDGDAFSHALQMAEKSAKDDKARQKIEDVIVRMCKDLKGELRKVEQALP